MKVTKEVVERVAELARLDFNAAELEQYTKQLNEILGYMEKLNELDTSEVEPTAHVLPLKNVTREDVSRRYLDNETALGNAPDKKDGMFKVPKIV